MRNVYLFTVSLFLMGCATISAGSIPGNTGADNRLKVDIANMIYMIERAQAPGCSGKIVDTRPNGMEGNTFLEEWIVESCGEQIVYPVKITPDPKGGAYFGVQTPTKDMR